MPRGIKGRMMIATFNESLQFLWQYLQPLKRRVVLLLGLLLGGIALQLISPQLIRRFLDQAQAGTAVNLMIGTAVLYLITVVSQKALTLLTTYVGEDLGWTATNQLRSDLASHCLRLDMGFHKLRTPGELIERIDGDVSTLAEYFSQLIVQVAGNGLLMMGVIALIFVESWPVWGNRIGLRGVDVYVSTHFAWPHEPHPRQDSPKLCGAV